MKVHCRRSSQGGESFLGSTPAFPLGLEEEELLLICNSK